MHVVSRAFRCGRNDTHWTRSKYIRSYIRSTSHDLCSEGRWFHLRLERSRICGRRTAIKTVLVGLMAISFWTSRLISIVSVRKSRRLYLCPIHVQCSVRQRPILSAHHTATPRRDCTTGRYANPDTIYIYEIQQQSAAAAVVVRNTLKAQNYNAAVQLCSAASRSRFFAGKYPVRATTGGSHWKLPRETARYIVSHNSWHYALLIPTWYVSVLLALFTHSFANIICNCLFRCLRWRDHTTSSV